MLRKMLINPYDITNYNRTRAELEEFLLFTIVVAGKTAYIQANKLEQFLVKIKNDFNLNLSPFELLKYLHGTDNLNDYVLISKLGQYNKILKAFKFLCENNIDLSSCSIDELEQIPGVGPKTSRFFLLHSRKCDVGILDVHLLKWIKSLGYENAPKTTPSDKKIYKKWELVFLDYCKNNNKNPAEFDLEIWKSYAKKEKIDEN